MSISTIPILGGIGQTLAAADATIDASAFATAAAVWFGAAYGAMAVDLYPTVQTGSEALLAYEQLLSDMLFTCKTRDYVAALVSLPPVPAISRGVLTLESPRLSFHLTPLVEQPLKEGYDT